MKQYVQNAWRTRAALLAALVMAMSAVGSASAHVGVNPAVVRPNTLETFSIRVPSEKEVPTIAVRIEFPAGLVVSRFQPKPGWERTVEKDSAGRTIGATWSGGTIRADEYEEFVFLARTPREPGPLVFKSYQTYEGGEIVAWTGGELDDFPASVVQVAAASDTATTATGTSIENPAVSTTAEQETAATPSADQAATDTAATPALAVTAAAEALATAPVATVIVETVPTMEVLATAGVPPAGGAVGTGSDLPAAVGGSDLPLFVALGALIIALVALALAGVALARRRPA